MKCNRQETIYTKKKLRYRDIRNKCCVNTKLYRAATILLLINRAQGDVIIDKLELGTIWLLIALIKVKSKLFIFASGMCPLENAR